MILARVLKSKYGEPVMVIKEEKYSDIVTQICEQFKTYDGQLQVYLYEAKSEVMFEQGIGEYAQLLQVRIFNPMKKYHSMQKLKK